MNGNCLKRGEVDKVETHVSCIAIALSDHVLKKNVVPPQSPKMFSGAVWLQSTALPFPTAQDFNTHDFWILGNS